MFSIQIFNPNTESVYSNMGLNPATDFEEFCRQLIALVETALDAEMDPNYPQYKCFVRFADQSTILFANIRTMLHNLSLSIMLRYPLNAEQEAVLRSRLEELKRHTVRNPLNGPGLFNPNTNTLPAAPATQPPSNRR